MHVISQHYLNRKVFGDDSPLTLAKPLANVEPLGASQVLRSSPELRESEGEIGLRYERDVTAGVEEMVSLQIHENT